MISGLPSDFFVISFCLLISFWFTVTSFLLAHTLQVRICISLNLRECYCSCANFFLIILSRCCCISSYLAYQIETFYSITNFSLPLKTCFDYLIFCLSFCCCFKLSKFLYFTFVHLMPVLTIYCLI